MSMGGLSRFRAGLTDKELAHVAKLRALPEEWQASFRPAYVWIDVDVEQSYRPIAGYVRNEAGAIRQISFHEAPVSADEMLSALLQSMYRPSRLSGGKRRPERIVLDRQEVVAALKPSLARIGIDCQWRARLDAIDKLQIQVCRNMTGEEPIPGLLSLPGVTLPFVRRLYGLAADFYERSPWRRLNDRHPIAISTPADAPPRYAVVMGSARTVFGLAVYDSKPDLDAMFLEEQPVAKGRGRSWSVLFFETARAMSFADLDSVLHHDLKICGPTGFPVFGRSTPMLTVTVPKPDDLYFMEAALAALVQHWDEADEAPGELGLWPVDRVMSLRGLSGPLEVRLRGDFDLGPPLR